MSAKSEICLQLRFYRGLYTILCLYFGSSDQLINLSQYHNRSVDLNRYTYILNCTLSNLSSSLRQLSHCILRHPICFATVVALRHPTTLTVLGSLPPLCIILYKLGMTGTLSRPNCVIFTSDSILLHTYT